MVKSNTKLKVLLVGMSPATIRKVRLKSIPMAPLVLKAYAESRLTKEYPGFVNLEVRTFFVEEDSPEEMASAIQEVEPDVVAFSVYIWNYYETIECTRIIRDRDKRIRIVCGGPQVSPIAMETMRSHPYIDVIPYISIPGEVIFYNLVKVIAEDKELDGVEGLIYRDPKGSLVRTSPLSENMDYSNVPSPYLNNSFFLEKGENYGMSLETSRGCPYDCGYCFNGRGMKKINYFPLERILAEIEAVYNNPNVKHVFYADSDLLLNRKRAEIIVEHILKQNSSAVSQFAINLLRLDERFAKLLARLPQYDFCFALQTANPKALNCIGRQHLSVDIFTQKIKEFRGWLPEASYSIDVMLGLPGDDFAGFRHTLDISLGFAPTRIALNYPVYLLPGTRFFAEKESLGFKYSRIPPFSVIETESFPKQDIEAALRLIIWVDILTYFYPAIGSFFYRTYGGGGTGARIGKMEKWISAIEEKIDLFGNCQNMVDIATGSVQGWNRLKAQILQRASETESAYHIYHAIQEQEKAINEISMEKTIALGVKNFDYMLRQQIDSVEFSGFEQLPDSITKEYHLEEIRSVFSRYKR